MQKNTKKYFQKYKKKIIFFCPSIEEGGVEKNLILTANELVNKYQVSIITANKNKKKKFKKKINIICPSIFNFSYNLRLIKSVICLIYGLVFLSKKSIIISYESNLFAIILAKLLNSKVIIRSNAHPKGYLNNNYKLFIFKIFFRLSNAVIVNSYEFKKSIDRLFKIRSKVLYNSLDNQNYFLKSKSKNKFIKNKNCYNLICIGRLVEQKDHLTILNALKVLKNKLKFKLTVLGKGKLINHLEAFCKKNELTKNVSFLGYKNNVYPYLKASDCLILSSLYEGQPNVILEAISMGKLVISSDCPTGPNEILLKGRAGYLFKPKNYKELASKIYFSFKNKKASIRKIQLASKTLKKYDIKKNTKEFIKIIENV